MTHQRVMARFDERLTAAMTANDSLVCVGLDPDLSRFPAPFAGEPDVARAIVAFNRAIVEATADLVCAYKPNLGFYVAYGLPGLAALVETRRLIPAHIPVILDAKIGDIPATTAAYARGIFDAWDFDAVTANPYLGADSLAPLLVAPGRGVFILSRTSNPGGGDLQAAPVGDEAPAPLYLRIADLVQSWATAATADVGLVVGATYPAELSAVRRRCPDLPILLPGVGAQGGDLEAAVRAGVDGDGRGLLVNSSRSVIYAGSGADFASDARAAALSLRDAINAAKAAA
ncbi:MAG TPA: orotidine-5'-phosphate decarboxylase [Thermomicrobiales bacterium]|nr:orotidine-5'-phosphate decarboxylase [Thermomicrobiales bacterium]